MEKDTQGLSEYWPLYFMWELGVRYLFRASDVFQRGYITAFCLAFS